MITEHLELYIKQIAAGDKGALKNLYEEMGQSIYSYAYTIVKDPQLAQDIAQDVFIRVLQSAKSYKPGKNPKAWLMSITHNEAVDTLRRRKNLALTDFTEPVASEQAVESFEQDVTSQLHIEHYLKQLDPVQQEIIKLHLLTEISFREIGQILGMTLGKVGWQYKSALQQLKILMKDEVLL